MSLSVPPPVDPAWRAARSFADLVTAARRFLTGEIGTFPGWGGADLDSESDALLPGLLAANAAGLLSVASQPGRPALAEHDGRLWRGRAFVGGFAKRALLRPLRAAAERGGLWLVVEGDGLRTGTQPPASVPVGLADGTPYLVLGEGARADELEIFEEHAGPAARAALEDCVFVWLVDPSWGRRDALPQALLGLVTNV